MPLADFRHASRRASPPLAASRAAAASHVAKWMSHWHRIFNITCSRDANVEELVISRRSNAELDLLRIQTSLLTADDGKAPL